tara:strand:- start:272 stop:805 length:534 start_codon:yes stop_codon:yes gene_type:complete
MSSYLTAPGLAKPTPLHALTPEAEDAHIAHRRVAYEDRMRREVARIVTDHGRPHVEPLEGDVVTAGARRLLADADARGWRTNLVELADRCVVEGIRGDEAFRASWVRGGAGVGTWHERRHRYAMIEDRRTVAIDEGARVGKAKHRTLGLDAYHLSIVASPRGVSIGVTAVAQRVKES